MCAPAVAAGVMVAGAALQAYSQHRKGKFDAAVAENNADLAQQQANDAITRGAYEARGVEIDGRRIAASARAATSANNVTGGSADNLVALSAANAATDAATVRANAVRAAWGFKAEKQDQLAHAKQASDAGLLGALGTGLSGAGQVGSYYAGVKKGP